MKLLRKLLLVNWHYVRSEVLDFKTINFLTGKNGSGKSTIIDALQLLLLGDTRGHFFNKAAYDRSNRSLKGYLRGEVAEDAQSNTIYLRGSEDFTSYIVAEFEDSHEDRVFCLGIIFDSYRDGDNKHQFFYLKAALPPHGFCPEEVHLNIRQLKAFLHNHHPKAFEFYETNRDYQQVMKGVLGNLNEKFFRLFRKAVPFSPIMDIKAFITEFVCDDTDPVDITDMQENIRQYKQLEEELARVEKRIKALEAITTQHQAWAAERRRLKVQSFLVDRAHVEVKRRHCRTTQADIDDLSERVQALNEQLAIDDEQLHDLKATHERLLEERGESDLYQKQQRLRQRRDQVNRQLEEISYNLERLVHMLSDHTRRWHETVRWCQEHLVTEDEDDQLPPATGILNRLKSLVPTRGQSLPSLDYETLGALKADLDRYRGALQRLQARLGLHLEECQQKAATLTREIAQLKQGIRPYPQDRLTWLQHFLVQELSQAAGRNVPVEILAELLEIREERWRDAIEGYLHQEKFHLLVEPEFFGTALRLYEQAKARETLHDLGLVDMEGVIAASRRPRPGSLVEAIQTDHPLAQAYCDYLLGPVMKCDDTGHLRQHKSAITDDGMLYEHYVARQLDPKLWHYPYIGREALKAQMQRKEEELTALRHTMDQRAPRYQEVRRLSETPPLTEHDIDTLLDLEKKVAQRQPLAEEMKQITDELGGMDFSYLEQLNHKIHELKETIARHEQRHRQNLKECYRTEERMRSQQQLLPQLRQQEKESLTTLERSYSDTWRDETGEPRFAQELTKRGTPARVKDAFQTARRGTQTRMENEWGRLLNHRADYNRDHRAGFDINHPDNHAYQKELDRLRDTLLLEYRAKIEQAKEKAQIQFQEDFISKLKAKIETVQDQIAELNRAIKDTPFGRDTYRFTVSRNPRFRHFYDMITDEMLMEGYNLFSQAFQEKHRDSVEELFRQIVDVGEGVLSADQRQRLQANLEQFTDYRTFLDFDLVNTDDQGREVRLSRVLSKKSGGETQTPFYVSVLASFLQVYRVQQGDTSTMRLIVFDEAYSKMDHQRIRESIKLIRDMGLQVILSAPTEKIGDIAPHVDRSLLVTRVKNETMVRSFDSRQLKEMGA